MSWNIYACGCIYVNNFRCVFLGSEPRERIGSAWNGSWNPDGSECGGREEESCCSFTLIPSAVSSLIRRSVVLRFLCKHRLVSRLDRIAALLIHSSLWIPSAVVSLIRGSVVLRFLCKHRLFSRLDCIAALLIHSSLCNACLSHPHQGRKPGKNFAGQTNYQSSYQYLLPYSYIYVCRYKYASIS